MSETSGTSENPCLSCGACCMTYRVSFYWAEAEARGLPPALTEQVAPHVACMAGTNVRAPHCAALRHAPGGMVSCSVYAQRPEPCRQVVLGDERCLRARARHGLPALAEEVPSL